jgi:hypothetical protein
MYITVALVPFHSKEFDLGHLVSPTRIGSHALAVQLAIAKRLSMITSRICKYISYWHACSDLLGQVAMML